MKTNWSDPVLGGASEFPVYQLFEKEIKISVVMWGFEPRSSL
jgi:hypothetical protein